MAAVAILGLAACGGQSQDANEPSGNFKVQVLEHSFPSKQKLAKRSTMVISIKNVDSRDLPNPTVTIDSFNHKASQPNVADPNRPTFIVNRGPVGGETANQATSALGHPLAPGQVATFKWNVTAVHAGRFKIHYTISAGLFGKAKAVDANGNTPHGLFAGTITNAAPHSTVNFKNGKSVQGG